MDPYSYKPRTPHIGPESDFSEETYQSEISESSDKLTKLDFWDTSKFSGFQLFSFFTADIINEEKIFVR